MPNSGDASPCDSLFLLFRLLLPAQYANSHFPWLSSNGFGSGCAGLSRERFDELVNLAQSNHVIVRGLTTFRSVVERAQDQHRVEWADRALAEEHARIRNAVEVLRGICAAFEAAGLDVTVIKSLDHWPDLGSDLDLYTNAEPDAILALMKSVFHAKLAPRSWGDRLARKWNFLLPDIKEPVEIHVGRLGQTGEQVDLAVAIPRRSRVVEIEGHPYRVPSATDRLLISTLQRMYRHFYFRLCDILDSAELVESGMLDFADLERTARAAGIWEGAATYLKIVSDYVKKYRGVGLRLPEPVLAAARFGAERVYYANRFLRIPLLPHSAGLYGSQLGGLLRKRELHSSARLGLLPWLATAAMVGQKITGSDKGIW
jgi:hypothetical protein